MVLKITLWSFSFSHDGRRVLASYGGDHVYLFDVSSTMSHPTTTIQIPQPVAATARHDDDDDQQMPDSAPEEEEEENKEREEPTKVTMEDDEEEEEINKRENKVAMEDDEEEKEKEQATRKEKKKSLASATITREFLQTYRGHANVQTVKEMYA